MKLQICAQIDGKFLIDNKVEAKIHPYDFEIFEREKKYFISITKPVQDYQEYAPKVYLKESVPHIEATNPLIYKDMEEWLFYIEAMGAFNFEVSKIHTDELEVNWIPETDDEKEIISISSLKRNREKPIANKVLRNINLSNLLIYRRMLPDAHIPFNYYRQAKNFFDNDNYYFAFINYFMMLEFCFAEGKFHKRKMIESFKKYDLLRLCVLSAISMLKEKDNDARNYKWLVDECKRLEKKVNYDGVIYILIEYRGLLSHASERSKKYLFNDSKLRPLAFIISMICFLLCGYMQVYSCSTEDSKRELMNKRISELESKIE